MGKRARRRGGPVPSAATDWRSTPKPKQAKTASDAPAKPVAAQHKRRRAKSDELPPPPWAPIPLVEICVLLGLVLMGLGVAIGGDKRAVMIVAGAALAAIAGLEQALREHLAGFRSHSTLLGGVVLALALALLSLAGLPRVVVGPVALALGALTFWRLRATFIARSGGFTYRA